MENHFQKQKDTGVSKPAVQTTQLWFAKRHLGLPKNLGSLLGMANQTQEAVEALAAAVAERRAYLGRSQLDVWKLGGPSNSTMTSIESAASRSVTASTLRKLDHGLDWVEGTAARVLQQELKPSTAARDALYDSRTLSEAAGNLPVDPSRTRTVDVDAALASLLAWEQNKSQTPLDTGVAAVRSLTRYLGLVHKHPGELAKSDQELVDHIEKLQARVLSDTSGEPNPVSAKAAARHLKLANELAAGVEALDRELDVTTDETKRAIASILAVGISLVTYSLDQPQPLDLDTSDPQQLLEQLRERQDQYAEVTLLFGAADRALQRFVDIAGSSAAKPSPTPSESPGRHEPYLEGHVEGSEAGRVGSLRTRKRIQSSGSGLSAAQVALDAEAVDYLGRVDELIPGAQLRQELETRCEAIPDRDSPAGYVAYLAVLEEILGRAIAQIKEQGIRDAATDLIAEGEKFLAAHQLATSGQRAVAARNTPPSHRKGQSEQGEAGGEESQDADGPTS